MKPVTYLKRAVAIFALYCVVVGSSLSGVGAQEITDEHVKIAKHAMRAIGSTRSLDKILPELAGTAKRSLIQNRPDLDVEITEIVDNVAIELAPRRGDLENEIAQMYARAFSVEELNQISEFYRSDAGKKLLKRTPIIYRGVEKAAKLWRAGIGRDLNEKIVEKMKADDLL